MFWLGASQSFCVLVNESRDSEFMSRAILRAFAWRLLILSPLIISACGDTDGLAVVGHTHHGEGDHTAHTGVEEGIWPPQPANMANVEMLPSSARGAVQGNVVAAARKTVLSNPMLRSALGDDYLEFQASMGDEKDDDVATFTFYNNSSNETIEAMLTSDGAVVYEVYEASQYQPSEHPDEVEAAIALVSAALSSDGFDIDGLTGTAMLAYPPRGSLTDPTYQFYPQRMMYVTFGEGGGAMPVHRALVNLQTGVVSESGLVN